MQEAVARIKALAQRMRHLQRCAGDLLGEIGTAVAELERDPSAPAAAPAAAPPPVALRRVEITCARHGKLQRVLAAADALVLERERRCPTCRGGVRVVVSEPAGPVAVVTPWRSIGSTPRAGARRCSLCSAPARARGLCALHYYRARRAGDLDKWPARRAPREDEA